MFRGVNGEQGLVTRIMFRRIKKQLGGCVRLIVVGSAPVSPPVLSFIRAALGQYLY